ncbi:ATP-binding cassette domain-containing protein [uncultured Ezakiella sp.]|uniref:ABC transporter ATP-binding protein n=1 Tax=uncultured Ezakiella sp. TaxID=1637529 RepID=UPI0025F6D10D|nr:ATP-binding cassette domain-containing protein [uncultured Ezakiella sp.]
MEKVFELKALKFKGILDIPDLTFYKGITSIIGKSGSGKTTLMLALNKMITPTSGDVYYHGENIKDMDAVKLRRKVLMLGQQPIIFPGNVRDNLNQGLKFAKKELADDKKLKELLDYVDLDKDLEDDPSEFSGGEKQRIAIGRVIAMDPDVYLLDEPSSALDSELANNTIEKLSQIAKEKGQTIIMVTHSEEIAKNISDKILFIDKGRVVKYE